MNHRCYSLIAVAILLCAAILPARAAAPQRVASIFLCTDEYVFRLLPPERIAALSILAGDTNPVVSTIAHKVQGIPLIRPSAEAVLATHPTLVVLYKGTNPRLKAQLLAAGVDVFEIPAAQSLADVRAITLVLGARLGAEDRARALLARMDAQLAAARARALHPPVHALIYEPNGYATADRVSDEIMAAAGLTNAVKSYAATRLGTVPVEAVIAAAPQLLIINAARAGAPALADAAIAHPALAALKGRSLIMRTSLTPLLCPGPWSADVAGEFVDMAAEAARLAKARAGD